MLGARARGGMEVADEALDAWGDEVEGTWEDEVKDTCGGWGSVGGCSGGGGNPLTEQAPS